MYSKCSGIIFKAYFCLIAPYLQQFLIILVSYILIIKGFPGGSYGKESACNAGDLGLIPGSGRYPGEGNGYPLLPGEFQGQRKLVSNSPWCCKESDMTE